MMRHSMFMFEWILRQKYIAPAQRPIVISASYMVKAIVTEFKWIKYKILPTFIDHTKQNVSIKVIVVKVSLMMRRTSVTFKTNTIES